MCHLYTSLIVKLNIPPVVGIKVVGTAIEKVRTSESQLTPLHADLCLLSLRAKYFKPALTILDVDITNIATTDVSNKSLKHFLHLPLKWSRSN